MSMPFSSLQDIHSTWATLPEEFKGKLNETKGSIVTKQANRRDCLGDGAATSSLTSQRQLFTPPNFY